MLYSSIKYSLIHKHLCSYMYVYYMGRVKRIWYLSPMRAAMVQASLRIRAVSPEPPLLAHTGSESRGTFRQKARSLAPLNGWACAVTICHDGMLEDTNSLDGAHMPNYTFSSFSACPELESFKGFLSLLVSLVLLAPRYFSWTPVLPDI